MVTNIEQINYGNVGLLPHEIIVDRDTSRDVESVHAQSLITDLDERFLPYITRQVDKARVYPVRHYDLPEAYDYHFDDMDYIINTITPYVKTLDDLRRGDIIVLANIPTDRNDGLFIYDGDNILYLDTEPDDYGSVPVQFKVPDEFPIYYWEDIVVHNSFVPFDFGKWAIQLIDNYTSINFETPEESTAITSGKFPATLFYSYFIYNDEKYYVIADNLQGQVGNNYKSPYYPSLIDKETYIQMVSSKTHLNYIMDDHNMYLLDIYCRVLGTDKHHNMMFDAFQRLTQSVFINGIWYS